MTIENDKKYKLTGEQIKDLASRFGVLSGEIGDLANLTTTDKSNLVAAINEAAGGGGGGSGIIELTSADYNYPTTGTATSVALWLLEPGMYHWAQGVSVSCYSSHNTSNAGNATVYGVVNNGAHVPIVYNVGSQYSTYIVYASKATGSAAVGPTAIATDSLVYADPNTREKVQIGSGASSLAGSYSIAIGAVANADYNYSIAIGGGTTITNAAHVTGIGGIALGYSAGATASGLAVGLYANATGSGSVALGRNSNATQAGEMNIGSTSTAYGYNSSNYRLLTGLYDPQSAHDAATKGYVDPTTDSSAPTTATVGRLGQIQIDTTTATAYMCVAVDTVTPAYTWKQITA